MKKRSKLSKLALSLAAVAALTGGVATVGLVGCSEDPQQTPGYNQTKSVHVTVDSGSGGRATTDKESYVSGDNIEIAIVPDTGFELDSVKVGNVDRTQSVRDGYLTIENVTEDITVAVTFKARVSSTVSYTVKDNRGGSAALSAITGYVGDTVTLAVSPEKGFDVMTIKVNGGDNLANRLTGNSIEIQLSAATVEIEIEFYAFPIKATVTSGEGGSATIASPKETYAIGDKIEVTVAPQTDWFLSALTVNGVDRKSDVIGDKLTLTVEEVGNINIAAQFDITPADIAFGITATRYGEEYDLEGSAVELKHENGRKYEGIYVTSQGKIVASVIPGKYTVTVQDCVPFAITVGKEGYQTAETTVYQPFKEAVAWNTSNVADDKVTINTDYGHLFVKDSMGDFVVTYNIKKLNGGNRMSFCVKYGTKIMGFSSALDVDNPGVWLPNSKDFDNKPWGDADYIINAPHDWFGFTTAEQSAYKSNSGIDITYVRKGSRLYVFFGERYVASWEMFGASEKVELAFTGWFPVGYELPVSIKTVESDITALVESTITATATHGTATLDHSDNKYDFGETVTVTLTPDAATAGEKYVLDRLTLDSESVDLSKVVDGTFTFTASKKAHSIVAEYKAVATASINIAITAEKFGESQPLTSVTLYNANYNQTLPLTGGRLKVDGLAVGEYYLAADGFVPVKITVTSTGTTSAVDFKYQLFEESEGWDITTVGEGGVTKLGSTSDYLAFKDAYGDFMYTAVVKHVSGGDKQGDPGNWWSDGFAFAIKIGNKALSVQIVGDVVKTRDNAHTAFGNGTAWVDFAEAGKDLYTLTSAEQQRYFGPDGIEFRVIRQGRRLYVMIGDMFVKSWDMGAGTDTTKIECRVVGWDMQDQQIPMTMNVNTSDINRYTDSAVSVGTTANHGTLSLDGGGAQKTYKKGDTVSVTLKANAHTDANKKYVLAALKLDSMDVSLDEIDSGVFTFTASKSTHTVTATFKEVDVVNLNVAVTAEKLGVAQEVTKVKLSGTNYAETEITLQNDGGDKKLVVAGLADDTYKISIDGYIPVTVTSTTTSVKLIYQPFAATEDWDISGYGNGTVTMNNGYGHLYLNGEYDDFAVTYKIKRLDDGKRVSFGVRYGGNKIYGFSSDLAAENAGVWLPGSSWDNKPWNDANYNDVDPSWHDFNEQLSLYQGDGVNITIVRKGKTLYLFIEDRYVTSWELFAEGEKVELAFTGWLPTGYELPVSVSTSSTAIQEWLDKTSA